MVAKLTLDLDRRIGALDRRIYGQFIEHLGRCVYGGIFDESSPLSDDQGYRRDVLAAVRALHVPVLRWPGGNFASGYHWLDGVGPVDQRPRRLDLAWHAEESNRFGTHEFIKYCRRIGAEPYICANLGSGTLDEAQAWVEYCNGTGDSYWANLRRRHGHPEPFGVKYWALGNELYGEWQIGALSADQYVARARDFANVMKWTDPSIQLVACGKFGWTEWDRIVLDGLAPYVDYLSLHIYTGSPDYYSNVFSPHQAERALRLCEGLIERVRLQQGIRHPIRVAYDEWNIWYREPGGSALEERYNLADALAVATYLNIFIRACRVMGMANTAQMVNVIAPIVTNERGLFLQPTYYPLWLYAEYMHEMALDVHVESATYQLDPAQETSPWFHRVADLGPFSLLDVAATCDADGHEVTLAVVNRDQHRGHTATIQLVERAATAGIVALEVNAPDPSASNSFEQPHNVQIHKRHLPIGGQRFTYTFPAHSLTVLLFHAD